MFAKYLMGFRIVVAIVISWEFHCFFMLSNLCFKIVLMLGSFLSFLSIMLYLTLGFFWLLLIVLNLMLDLLGLFRNFF